MSDVRIADRALGAYLGLAVGDALGATTEFMTRREIAHRYGVHDRIIGGGWLRLPAGAVTDDTEMSLALGKAIIEAGGFDLSLVADAFVTWIRSKPVDCGHTCRRGIRRYMLEGTLAAEPNEGDAGNGALMRNLPVVLSNLASPVRMRERTLAQCHVTHHHPYSDGATLCFAEMAASLIRGEPAEVSFDLAGQFVAAQPAFRYEGYQGPATAYVVDTVRTVLSAYAAHTSFEQTLVDVVNRGDDADTTGALAGMLAGARYGTVAIPCRWLDKLDRTVVSRIRDQVPALLSIES